MFTSPFLMLIAVMTVVALVLRRPRKHLLIMSPLVLAFLLSAVCMAFYRELGLNAGAEELGLRGYIVSSFLGMLLDNWLRRH